MDYIDVFSIRTTNALLVLIYYTPLRAALYLKEIGFFIFLSFSFFLRQKIMPLFIY